MINPRIGTFVLPRKPRKGDWIVWEGDAGDEHETTIHTVHRRRNTVTVTAPIDWPTPLCEVGIDQIASIKTES